MWFLKNDRSTFLQLKLQTHYNIIWTKNASNPNIFSNNRQTSQMQTKIKYRK